MIFTNHIPEPPLDNYLECLFHFEGYKPEHSIEKLVPDGSINIIIELDGKERHVYDNETLSPKKTYSKAWLSGMHKDYISISALPDSELFVIRFKPGGCFPFLKIPVEEINDQVMDAQEILGDKIIVFREELLQIEGAENKLVFGEKWVKEHLDIELKAEKAIDNAVKKHH